MKKDTGRGCGHKEVLGTKEMLHRWAVVNETRIWLVTEVGSSASEDIVRRLVDGSHKKDTMAHLLIPKKEFNLHRKRKKIA